MSIVLFLNTKVEKYLRTYIHREQEQRQRLCFRLLGSIWVSKLQSYQEKGKLLELYNATRSKEYRLTSEPIPAHLTDSGVRWGAWNRCFLRFPHALFSYFEYDWSYFSYIQHTLQRKFRKSIRLYVFLCKRSRVTVCNPTACAISVSLFSYFPTESQHLWLHNQLLADATLCSIWRNEQIKSTESRHAKRPRCSVFDQRWHVNCDECAHQVVNATVAWHVFEIVLQIATIMLWILGKALLRSTDDAKYMYHGDAQK